MRNFLFTLLAITVLLSAIGYFAFTQLWPDQYTPALPIAMLIIATVTAAAHYFLTGAVRKTSQRDFNTLFMSVTGGKLMFYLFGIVIYVVLNTENAKTFLIGFLIFYFIYTSVEVISIMSYIKRFRSKGN